jgi:hypothetical protein
MRKSEKPKPTAPPLARESPPGAGPGGGLAGTPGARDAPAWASPEAGAESKPPATGTEPGGRGGDEEKRTGSAASPFGPAWVAEVMIRMAPLLTGLRILPAVCVTGATACVAALVTGATTLPTACVAGAAVCVMALLTGARVFPAVCVTGATACVAALVTGVTTFPAACVTGAAVCVAGAAVSVTVPVTLPSAPVTGPRALAWLANASAPSTPEKTALATRQAIRVPTGGVEG